MLNRCTLGLKSTSPTATQQRLLIGKLQASAVSLINLRSRTSMSRGSVKISMVSKPILAACSMPNFVPLPAWAKAELIRPSFMQLFLGSIVRIIHLVCDFLARIAAGHFLAETESQLNGRRD